MDAGSACDRSSGCPLRGRAYRHFDSGNLERVLAGPKVEDTYDAGIAGGPDVEQAEQLRKVILAKNLLYFHRWRPQNETYLLGFRKHEQGQNAVEIPQFDPLVEAEEATIRELSIPVEREYELVRVDLK